MLDKNVVVGMKVVPHSKSIGVSFEKEPLWLDATRKNNQFFLYVIKDIFWSSTQQKAWELSDKENDPNSGNYWLSSDFEPYEEGLKDEDIKIGMKVVPFKKTVTGWENTLDNSPTWINRKIGQNYLYVVGWDKEYNCWLLSNNIQGSGDFFNASDLKLYKEPEPNKIVDVCTATFLMGNTKVEVTKITIEDKVTLSIKEIK
jgi:hypothetical protein